MSALTTVTVAAWNELLHSRVSMPDDVCRDDVVRALAGSVDPAAIVALLREPNRLWRELQAFDFHSTSKPKIRRLAKFLRQHRFDQLPLDKLPSQNACVQKPAMILTEYSRAAVSPARRRLLPTRAASRTVAEIICNR